MRCGLPSLLFLSFQSLMAITCVTFFILYSYYLLVMTNNSFLFLHLGEMFLIVYYNHYYNFYN